MQRPIREDAIGRKIGGDVVEEIGLKERRVAYKKVLEEIVGVPLVSAGEFELSCKKVLVRAVAKSKAMSFSGEVQCLVSGMGLEQGR